MKVILIFIYYSDSIVLRSISPRLDLFTLNRTELESVPSPGRDSSSLVVTVVRRLIHSVSLRRAAAEGVCVCCARAIVERKISRFALRALWVDSVVVVVVALVVVISGDLLTARWEGYGGWEVAVGE